MGGVVRKGLGYSIAKTKRGLAYYPLSFYFGIAFILIAGFFYWAHYQMLWQFDWLQLKRWITNHATELMIIFSALLGSILVCSALAYRQVVDLSKEDYTIWLHQRATRVLFPIFTPLHDWIRLRSRFYQWWHAQSISSAAHIIILAFTIAGFSNYLVNYVSSAQASHGCAGATEITVNTTWSTSQCLGDVTVRNGATLTIAGGVVAELTSLSVGSDALAQNGFIATQGDTLNGTGVTLEVDGDVYIRAGSSISGDSQGYAGGTSGSPMGKGPGAGSGNGTHQAGSGAYGGNGGDSDAANNPGGTYYGSLNAPDDLGSGGGFATGCCNNNGGAGGGAVKINAPAGTVTVNGTISMNGGNGGSGCCVYGGGGSGGSIWIIADALAGNGTVRANGGVHGGGSSGASGGRIRIEHNSNTSTLTRQAFGGGTGAWARGGAGTILTDDELILANNSSSTAFSRQTFIDEDVTAPTSTIKDAVHIGFPDETISINTGATTIQNNVVFSIYFDNITWTGTSLTTLTGTNFISISPDIVNPPSFTGNISVSNTLSHWWNTANHDYSLILETDGDFTVNSGATIDLDSKGYIGGAYDTSGSGPGGGSTGTTGGGAGHGGNGDPGENGGAAGVVYGDREDPTQLGSGGGGGASAGGCCTGVGGAGGGSAQITSGGTVTITGTISANGGNGEGVCCKPGGAGSGGSVNIEASALAGSGTVRANGGIGGCYSFGCSSAGNGAGGRINIDYSSTSASLTTQTYGGIGDNPVSKRGGAGTVLNGTSLKVANDPSNNSISSPVTPFSGTISYASTEIKDRANVEIAAGSTLSTGSTTIKNVARLIFLDNEIAWSGTDLTVGGDGTTSRIQMYKDQTPVPNFSSVTIGSGTLIGGANATAHDYSILLNSTGSFSVTGTIDANGYGYSGGDSGHPGGYGPGAGNTGSSGGGGGHAGKGGQGSGTGTGGNQYGSLSSPTDIGSGGAYAVSTNGGAGGGAIKLIADGAMTVSGTITANGNAGNASVGGGGSGGSIWLVSDTLSGSGTVRANGGIGGCCSGNGGAGSGGRIRFDIQTDNSSLTKQAYGGDSASRRGAAGTILTNASLTIANDPTSTTNLSPLTIINENISVSSTDINDAAQAHVAASVTLNSGATTIQDNSAFRLLGTDTVWTGTTLSVQTGTNYIDVLPDIVSVPHFTGNISISNTLTHWWNTTSAINTLKLSTNGNITINSGGSINVDGKGYSGGGGNQNGNGPGGGQGKASGGSGGGGYGGTGGSLGGSNGTGGAYYGNALQPTDLGSGGGGTTSNGNGGAGGGSVKLSAPNGTVTFTGGISANGGAGGASQGGGGSGGSIWVIADTLAGSGSLTVNGAAGGCCSGTGGDGAGGRMQLTYNTDNSTSTRQAFGSVGSDRGAAGTISTSGGLTVAADSSNSSTSPVTQLPSGTYSYPSFTLKDYARLVVEDNTTFTSGISVVQNTSRLALLGNGVNWTGSTLTVSTGTNGISIPPSITNKPYFSGNISISNTLNHTDNDDTHDYSLILRSGGNITVESGAVVDLNGLGYWGGWLSTAGSGPGGGATAASSGGGGGHGGAGGNASSGALGGSANGDALNPTSLGSGGGGDSDAFAGDGGGAVELAAAGTLTITGTVRANALNGGGNGSGGGAGGSVKLIAGTIAGNGAIQATGGNGTSGGGCGGGGRLARHYNSSTFSGTVSVAKGTGNGSCGDGTNQTVTAVTNFLVSGHASPHTAGSTGTVTVVARDASNNQNQSFTGTISFTSSDGQAVLPSNYAFTVQNGGTNAFTNQIILKTAGTQSVTATQVGSPAVTGSQSSITVNPAATSVLTVAGIDDPVTAGTSSTVVVTAKDAYNNTATDYLGAIAFTSSDTQAVLPSNFTFSGGDNGTKTFTNGVTLKTSGEQTVTATDTVAGSINGSQAAITVTPAAHNKFSITGLTTPTSAGVAHSPLVTAQDEFDNTITGYTGTVQFGSSDTTATLPANYSFQGADNGTRTFNNGVTFKKTGSQTVTVTDTVSNISATSSSINVASAEPEKFVISGVTTPILTGSATSMIVEVLDGFDNRVTGYSGTVSFTSTDTAASLPTNYTFTGGDAGIHTFPSAVTFNTVGTHSLTATDTTNTSVVGTLAGISVTAPATPGNSGATPGGEQSGGSQGSSQGGQGNQSGSTPGGGQGSDTGGSGSGAQPIHVTFIIINTETGEFTGLIEKPIGGTLLKVEISGTVSGSTLSGTVSGTYGDLPVAGSITGTVKNDKITTAQITLFSSADSGFSLSVFVGGDIQSSASGNGKKDSSKCVMEGELTTTIDGQEFVGTVKFSILDDGTLKGTIKGRLNGRHVSGSFTALSYDAEITGGTVTLVAQNGKNDPLTGEISGSVDPGEIQLTSARNCTVNGRVFFTINTPPIEDNDGDGDTVISIPDNPGNNPNSPLTGPINSTITDPNSSNTTVLVLGTVTSTIGDITIRPEDISSRLLETRDLAAGAIATVAGVSTLPLLPAITGEILTSSVRGIPLFNWLFFGYSPRRKRKFWGVIRDERSHVPVAGLLVKLVNVATGQAVRQHRTDRTGRYGFLIETAGQYTVSITDPLYHAYTSPARSVSDAASVPLVTEDILLTPIDEKQSRLAKKTLNLLVFLKALNFLHWPVLVGGTFFSAYLFIDQPTTLRSLAILLYLMLWMGKILSFRRERHYGQVLDESGQALAKAVIQLTSNDKRGVSTHVHSTVTDNYGRFILLVKPGVYDMIVTKEGFVPRHGAVIADEANMVIRLKRA